MKKLLLITILSIGVLSVKAQDNTHPSAEQRAKALTELMDNKLNLDDAQQGLVAELNLRYANKVDEIAATDATKPEKVQKVSALNDAKEKELKTILSGPQYTKYVEMKEDFREKMAD
ncbi:MAG: hypothetical protein IPL12_05710 [Bacteroidetes bacterium]|nr:hypothetical protein [Bacteroidota bacterium]MBK8342856.1 hypothetical protein [Bacteroidota bacterium]